MKVLTLLMTFALLVPLFAADGFQIIVNASNTTGALSKPQISKIFLKKQTEWDDGVSIEPVEQAAESEIRKTFSLSIHRRPVAALKKYWLKQAFSGASTEPPEKASDEEVIAYVASQPGAIGYVSDGASLPNTVKALAVE